MEYGAPEKRWCPPHVLNCFINPMKTIDISPFMGYKWVIIPIIIP
jgi:hypothetical protein